MLKELGKMITFAIYGNKIESPTNNRMQDWFKIEYGKEWQHALRYYMDTGSIHWKG